MAGKARQGRDRSGESWSGMAGMASHFLVRYVWAGSGIAWQAWWEPDGTPGRGEDGMAFFGRRGVAPTGEEESG